MFKLLKRSFLLIKKDPIILVPNIAFFFIVQTLQPYLQGRARASFVSIVVEIICIGWLLEMFVRGYTISMAIDFIKNKKLHVVDSFRVIVNKYISVLLSTGILLLPLFFILGSFLQEPDPNRKISILEFLTVLVALPLSVLVQFVPVFIIMEDEKWFSAVVRSFRFLRYYFKDVLKIVWLIAFVGFGSILMSVFVSVIPLLGKSVFQVIVQGIGSSLIYVGVVYFFVDLKNRSQISKVA